MTFSEILNPIGEADFLRRYWGREYCLQSGAHDRFSTLLPWNELNRILSHDPEVDLYNEGNRVPPERYTTFRQNGRTSIKSDELMRMVRSGATLVVHQLERWQDPIAELAASMMRATGSSVQVNLYAAWGDSHGFKLHWDDHDVVILQVHGKKKWRVFEPSRKFPIRTDRRRGTPFAPPAEPVWEGLLEQGSLLYMPRGWWHQAMPLNTATMHLTFGIRSRTGLDLVEWLRDELASLEIFRMDLPRHATENEKLRHCENMRRALLDKFTGDSIDKFLAWQDGQTVPRRVYGFPLQVAADLTLPSGNFSMVSALSLFDLNSSSGSELVNLSFEGRTTQVPHDAVSILSAIAGRGPVQFDHLRFSFSQALGEVRLRQMLVLLAEHGLIAIRQPN